jgi:hypothetical protein
MITVALLFGTALLASLAGGPAGDRPSKRTAKPGSSVSSTRSPPAAAVGESIDRLAAEGIYTLLDARRVVIRRGDPDHKVVVADIGEPEASLDVDRLTISMPRATTVMDAFGRARGSVVRWLRPSQGAVLQLVQHRQPVGRLIVTFREGQWTHAVIRPWPPWPTPWRRLPGRPSATTSRNLPHLRSARQSGSRCRAR